MIKYRRSIAVDALPEYHNTNDSLCSYLHQQESHIYPLECPNKSILLFFSICVY